MTPSQSRKEARGLMKSIPKYSKLLKDRVVHHIDHNPFNNNLDNLAVVSKSTHHSMHPRFILTRPQYGIGKRKLTFKKLEEDLILYNFNL